MDFDIIQEWLLTSLSQKSSVEKINYRINKSIDIVPNKIQYKGTIATFAILYYWINSDINTASSIVESFKDYEFLKLKKYKSTRVFFIYAKLLIKFRIENPLLYQCDKNMKKLYILGESHSLSLANLSLK